MNSTICEYTQQFHGVTLRIARRQEIVKSKDNDPLMTRIKAPVTELVATYHDAATGKEMPIVRMGGIAARLPDSLNQFFALAQREIARELTTISCDKLEHDAPCSSVRNFTSFARSLARSPRFQ